MFISSITSIVYNPKMSLWQESSYCKHQDSDYSNVGPRLNRRVKLNHKRCQKVTVLKPSFTERQFKTSDIQHFAKLENRAHQAALISWRWKEIYWTRAAHLRFSPLSPPCLSAKKRAFLQIVRNSSSLWLPKHNYFYLFCMPCSLIKGGKCET